MLLLSIVIPARNEEGSIRETCEAIIQRLTREGLNYEIIIVDDHSSDGTEAIARELCVEHSMIRYFKNTYREGFGFAIRTGIEAFTGDAVCIVMADLSDSPDDIVTYYRKLEEGYECVFGSRFMKGSRVIDYPWFKLIINRAANWFIKMLFGLDHNDITNAFKCYRREVIEGIQPILSNHFNLTVEMPLKAIVRGYTHAKIPIRWTNRQTGISKLKLQEMGSRYLFIVLYVWLEKLLARGDYRR
jgi:dolichol-phosphate mannosyltransferase